MTAPCRADAQILTSEVAPKRGNPFNAELQRQGSDISRRHSRPRSEELVECPLPLRSFDSCASDEMTGDDQDCGRMFAVAHNWTAALAAVDADGA